jgi:hypothetical protein
MARDPLDGIETMPLDSKVAVLANEMRNLSNRVDGVERRFRSMQVSIWALVVAFLSVAATLLAGHVH